ncbi:MAG: sodium/proton-translocating pyrophosphatase [Candidatus Saccharibacteria bacterium]|nr:sodium/proton-translocating pyrophosphatase [Candidatus Saccharibacteria bacterium]
MYEVFLTAKNVSVEQWRALVVAITKMCRQGEKFELRFVLEMPSLRIFLVTDRRIPNSIAKLEGFIFRQCEALNIPEPTSFSFLPLAVEESDSLINVIDKFAQKGLELIAAHKASVTGDTVGDTRKDVVGVAIDIFIKSMATVANTFAMSFKSYHLF